MTFNQLIDKAAAQDHWLRFDLDDARKRYRIRNKTFGSIAKASDEIDRLIAQRASWGVAA